MNRGLAGAELSQRLEDQVQTLPRQQAADEEQFQPGGILPSRRRLPRSLAADRSWIDAYRLPAPRLVAVYLRNLFESLLRCGDDLRGRFEGGTHPGCGHHDGDAPQRIPKPAPPSQPSPQVPGRIFPAADRSKGEGDAQPAHEAGNAEAAPRDVLHAVEAFAAMERGRKLCGGVLPEEVVNIVAERHAVEQLTRAGQIVIDEPQSLRGKPLEVALDAGPVRGSRHRHDLMAIGRDAPRPVPADAGLGAVGGKTRIRREKDFHSL